MKKSIIVGLMIIGILLVSSCSQKITCNKPYILVGDNCCLDKDDDGVCDKDETKKEDVVEVVQCSDECTVDSCEGYGYIACEKQVDGCKDKINNGNVKGKCNVQCLDDSDCPVVGMGCVDFACEYSEPQCSDECSQDSCINGDYAKCELRADGCKYYTNLGKSVGRCGVECITDKDCPTGVSCTNNVCWNPPVTE